MAIPKPKVFWPLTISITNRTIYFTVVTGTETHYQAFVAQGTYYRPVDLRDAVAAAIFAASGATVAVTITDDGYFRFDSVGWNFKLRFQNPNSSAAPWLGFGQAEYAATGTGLWTLTAPRQHANAWYSPVAVRSDSKPYFEEPNAATTVSMGGRARSFTEGELICRDVYFEHLPGPKVFVEDQDQNNANPTAIENWWRLGRGRFRYFPDGADELRFNDWFLDGTAIGEDGFRPRRMYEGKARYAVGPWKMRRYIA